MIAHLINHAPLFVAILIAAILTGAEEMRLDNRDRAKDQNAA